MVKPVETLLETLRRDHGPLVTWRSKGEHIVLHLPAVLVDGVAHSVSARHDIRLRELTGLMLHQLEKLPEYKISKVLGSEYVGNRGDYQRLIALVCRELMEETT